MRTEASSTSSNSAYAVGLLALGYALGEALLTGHADSATPWTSLTFANSDFGRRGEVGVATGVSAVANTNPRSPSERLSPGSRTTSTTQRNDIGNMDDDQLALEEAEARLEVIRCRRRLLARTAGGSRG
jgi:hypothetical protein